MLKAVNLLYPLFNTSLKLDIHMQRQLSVTSEASNLLSSLFNISEKLSYLTFWKIICKYLNKMFNQLQQAD
jgi:hypothetical protein